ncbi:galactokinase [Vanrija albida]|uniref:Galactokinase n=1 Tax=Vanrija albida TaxID=181172 RepID=A0ABR3Q8Q2_9TREE
MSAAKLPIPVFTSLSDVYPEGTVPGELTRWTDLAATFEEKYGAPAAYVARAPGRVNILGEHIDYSLFPVLPAAIEQDIIIALRPREGPTVRLANVDPRFPPAEFELRRTETGWDADFDGSASYWGNYAKAAILECLARFFPPGSKDPVGLDLLMSGTVPPGAGLSSSAAFVVSSVIMFLAANGLTDGKSKGDVVEMAIASEHRLGLRTGGMDQSASALCLKNSLLHLAFHPNLDPTPLPLPEGLAVVITNSLAPHSLADSAPERYNLRVVEVLVASRLLLHAWGIDDKRIKASGEDGRIWLKEALDLWQKKEGVSDHELFEKALAALPDVLGKNGRDIEGWTKDEMIAASGMSPEAFTETYLNFIPVRAERFHLYKRAYHTFAESLRVSLFKSRCEEVARDPISNPADDPRAWELGALLNGSHDSLRDLFEATVPEVEELRDLCNKHGALGARQTGGGWGGAVISLLPVQDVPAFLDTIKKSYPPFANLSPKELEDAAFATLPGVGAGVYQVNGKIN